MKYFLIVDRVDGYSFSGEIQDSESLTVYPCDGEIVWDNEVYIDDLYADPLGSIDTSLLKNLDSAERMIELLGDVEQWQEVRELSYEELDILEGEGDE